MFFPDPDRLVDLARVALDLLHNDAVAGQVDCSGKFAWDDVDRDVGVLPLKRHASRSLNTGKGSRINIPDPHVRERLTEGLRFSCALLDPAEPILVAADELFEGPGADNLKNGVVRRGLD